MDAANHPLDLFIRKLETHAPLSEEDREAICALPFTLKTLEPQAYAVREGDRPDQCAILISGFAYRQKLTGEGDRQIVAVQVPGDPLDLQNLFFDISDHNVQMLTRAKLAVIPRSAVQQLARSRPGIGHAISVVTLVEASIFREWVLNVGRRNARARMAHLLCEFAIRLEAQGVAEQYGYDLPMSQEQLADSLGLTPVHVNRTLRTLDAEGLIVREKRAIRFPDWKRLMQVGDFNTRYLHLAPQVTGPN